MQARLERAIAELVLGAGFPATDRDACEAWLARHSLSEEDASYLRAQGLERLLTYRRLVRGTLREAIEVMLPRTLKRLGPVFDEYFDRFLRERGPRTHYLRDVTPEFLEFSAPEWAVDPRIPPYLIELADHELLRLEIAAMPVRATQSVERDLELEHGVEFIDACRITYYEYAIHELSEDENLTSPALASPTWLFVYRSPDHEVRYLKLTPLAAAILTRLSDLKETLAQAITTACAEHDTAVSEPVLNGTAGLLADLADRGALLGRRDPD